MVDQKIKDTEERSPRLLSYLQALTALLQVVVWPAVVVIAIGVFQSSIRSKLESMSNVSLKGPGIEMTAVLEAGAMLGAASMQKNAPSEGDGKTTPQSFLPHGLAIGRLRELVGAKVLWVDDHPENNQLEQSAFEALGVQVSTATDTATAQAQLRSKDGEGRPRYKVVISDTSRGEDGCKDLEQASQCAKCEPFKLIDWIRTANSGNPPIIFYTTQKKADLCRKEVVGRGAFGITGEPSDLLRLVAEAINGVDGGT